jgi:hypothetical protein
MQPRLKFFSVSRSLPFSSKKHGRQAVLSTRGLRLAPLSTLFATVKSRTERVITDRKWSASAAAAKAMLANPDIGVTQIAHRLGVSPTTHYRYIPAARTANTPGV